MLYSPSKQINVYLVGPMGSGKTTIGRQLAKVLRVEFIDSDHEIEARTGATIPWIFDIEGEEGFRKREKMVIEDLTRRKGVVLATGGGVVLAPENRGCLQHGGIVVYLRASLDELFERTAKDKNRPLLQTEDPKAKLGAILQEREPLYLEVADLVVDTGRKGVRPLVRELAGRVKRLARRREKVAKQQAKEKNSLST
ncbi:MAG TPA: shikimate kinase AroK [Candidatus Tenderia sp.]|nr:shikimate kinase AroK [Candidatus Tenderia sp.]